MARKNRDAEGEPAPEAEAQAEGEPTMDVLPPSAQEDLARYIRLIENLNEEKAEAGKAVSDAYKRAKSQGFDVKALREVIRRRKMARLAKEMLDELVQLYEGTIDGPAPEAQPEAAQPEAAQPAANGSAEAFA